MTEDKESVIRSYDRWFLIVVMICFALVCLILLIGKVLGYDSSVGIEQNGSFLHAWNNGTIERETWFNVSSGLLQVANRLERTKDITYVFGFLKNTSGVYTYIGSDVVSDDIKYASDNVSGYWASARINKSYSGGDWIIYKNNSQSLNDDLVNMTFYGQVNKSFTGDFYFVSGIRNLDILRDGVAEKITVINGNDVLESFTNVSGTFWRGNITRIVIDGGMNAYSFDLRFPKGVIGIYNHTSPSTNGDFTFLTKIGNIAANTKYQTVQQWIDADCAITCSQNCQVYGISNISSDIIASQSTKYANVGCAWRVRAIQPQRCTGNCTVSSACSLIWAQNTSSTTTNIISPTETDKAIKCESSVCSLTGSFTFNTYYYRDLRTSHTGGSLFLCNVGSANVNPFTIDVDSTFSVSKGDPLTTIWSPVNNTLLTFLKNWAIFGVNNTGNITADNITLYLNSSANSTSAPNLSRNVSFDVMACWIYTAKACYSHNCAYSQSGNFTICFNVNASSSDVLLFHTVQVKKKRIESDVFLFLLVAGFALELMAFYFINDRRKNGEGE